MKVEKKELKNAERDLKKLQQSEVHSNYYEFQQVLGEGAFCTVYQALDLETGEVVEGASQSSCMTRDCLHYPRC